MANNLTNVNKDMLLVGKSKVLVTEENVEIANPKTKNELSDLSDENQP